MPERVIPVQCHAWSNRRGSATCSAVAVHRFVLLCLRLASRVLASPRPSLCSTSPCHRKAEHSSPTPPRICAHPARIETRLCEAMPDARHCGAIATRCASPQFRCCVSHRYACSCAHPCHANALTVSLRLSKSVHRKSHAMPRTSHALRTVVRLQATPFLSPSVLCRSFAHPCHANHAYAM